MMLPWHQQVLYIILIGDRFKWPFLMASILQMGIQLLILFELQGQIQPQRACLMPAIWLWITNALSKIFPAILYKH